MTTATGAMGFTGTNTTRAPVVTAEGATTVSASIGGEDTAAEEIIGSATSGGGGGIGSTTPVVTAVGGTPIVELSLTMGRASG
ncbi:MAG: hypothetical protein A2942_00950 [Candidatus Lloydbacteria bacterium RIFCSPLOWO2_01_FULL_50_20]|uniref:Uncharacterized protein n=1 Tax=Candidatus Lloydbacteria bacterium RIFCSPLOWO2_01_FULL_50_20 TaxID=1798665 RepID=A0A1G2DHL8_9BACT|nr:MAG: hypothetical protein A2942_00950 [Candidatus Lloydbacteria bacterium RIFCSPLOWO2_01_FULL_50_20]